MRLFVGDPVWTPFNRPHDHLPARCVLFSYNYYYDGETNIRRHMKKKNRELMP